MRCRKPENRTRRPRSIVSILFEASQASDSPAPGTLGEGLTEESRDGHRYI